MQRDDHKCDVFKSAKRMVKSNQDVVGEQCIRYGDDVLSVSDDNKKIDWKSYEKLLNAEFAWDRIVAWDSLTQSLHVTNCPGHIQLVVYFVWKTCSEIQSVRWMLLETVQAAGGGDYLERRNYTGPKLTDQILKKAERIIKKLIQWQVKNDEMQFAFMLRYRVILRKKRRILYFVLADLQKAFDWAPRDILWWALRKLGAEEVLVKIVHV